MHELGILFNKALHANHIHITEQAKTQLLNYLSLMQKWNRVFNLTSITTPSDMIYLHLIDSLLVAPFLNGKYCLDVGSGAGLPGIPLAIVNENIHWVLLDKNSKKTRFLNQVCAELELKNVRVVQSSAENFKTQTCFDSILSRALGTLTMFLESTEHLICEQGLFIAMKGKYPETELHAVSNAYSIQEVMQLQIQGMNLERHLVCLRKTVRN